MRNNLLRALPLVYRSAMLLIRGTSQEAPGLNLSTPLPSPHFTTTRLLNGVAPLIPSCFPLTALGLTPAFYRSTRSHGIMETCLCNPINEIHVRVFFHSEKVFPNFHPPSIRPNHTPAAVYSFSCFAFRHLAITLIVSHRFSCLLHSVERSATQKNHTLTPSLRGSTRTLSLLA